MLPGLLCFLVPWIPDAGLLAQEPHAEPSWTSPAAQGGHEPTNHQPAIAEPPTHEPPTHRADARLSPAAILAFLEARLANEAKAPPDFARPAGMPRHVVAVLGCSDLQGGCADCLRLPASEVQTVANAGGEADLGAIEVLERAVARGEVRLIVTLSHDGCASLLEDQPRRPAPAAGSPAEFAATSRAEQRALLRRSAALMGARAHHVPLVRAHAQLQRELLLASSDVLRHACAEGRLLIVAATAQGPENQVRIHARNRDRQGIAVVDPTPDTPPAPRRSPAMPPKGH